MVDIFCTLINLRIIKVLYNIRLSGDAWRKATKVQLMLFTFSPCIFYS
jgi:hypothetical protein